MDTDKLFNKVLRKFVNISKEIKYERRSLDRLIINFNNIGNNFLCALYWTSILFVLFGLVFVFFHNVNIMKIVPFFVFEMVLFIYHLFVLYKKAKIYKKIKAKKEKMDKLFNKVKDLETLALMSNLNNCFALTLGYKGTKDFTEENQKQFKKEVDSMHSYILRKFKEL